MSENEEEDVVETECRGYGVDETDDHVVLCEATMLSDGRVLLRWVVL